ncbi:GspH/FimT family pseudopilin [Pseudomonas sp. X10]
MRQQGVTLIQLMSGLALVGLLTQIGIPSYTHMSMELQQQTAARDLAQTLRIARSHAVLRNQRVVVQALQGDWGLGWRMLRAEDQQLLQEKRHGRPLTIIGNQPVATQVTFSGLGVPLRAGGAFQGGTLHVCQRPEGTSQHQVVLSPSGRVSLRQEVLEHRLCAGT